MSTGYIPWGAFRLDNQLDSEYLEAHLVRRQLAVEVSLSTSSVDSFVASIEFAAVLPSTHNTGIEIDLLIFSQI